ncbi:hypothetical protein [Mariniblastus fucicola]|uniref:Uncharacterized protein n=1 Tax=Mariniblastus fucicola TaxID=980251 RepID=A0A5B9PGR1_9BACT|nr:hypothetical protein [Mariniblastus fucicola]QEG23786.1 hypothetical protein MFFC18_36890 [Mariniblastus fucicola]
MWRSLFYSVGIGLFALGLQALVLDHVLVPKNTKLQKLVKKILSDEKPGAANNQPVQQSIAQTNAPNWAGQPQTQSAPANQTWGTNTGSRFGPSRFAGPAYGTGYGGGRVGSAQTGNSPIFSGYQNQSAPNAQLAGYRTSEPMTVASKPKTPVQKIQIREWMPWSLLASGAIIFLYTHSHRRHGMHE